ncbi:MAG: hypothetical protein EKK53_07115 [Burkholderiales bacterium]|nr:MAG: hypothetical protein EKK53_07115 [Burkholderiales bacterium]
MSYILDALRRAEADRERERGAVPGLHAQPAPEDTLARSTSPRRWLPWAGGGLLLIAGVGTGVWWAGSARETTAPVPATAPAASPELAAPVPAAPAPAPVTAAITPPAPAASVSPYLPPVPPPAAVVASPAPAPRAAPPAEPARLPLASELPEATRRELPRLALGGSVYSDDPRSRLVIINGDVLHEGARLGPDLLLEQIRPRELVLRFKGQAYRQPL